MTQKLLDFFFLSPSTPLFPFFHPKPPQHQNKKKKFNTFSNFIATTSKPPHKKKSTTTKIAFTRAWTI